MKDVEKARELLNANITHVSYVDKGANQKKFFLTKSESQDAAAPVFEKQVKLITKADDEQMLVYGIVYAPDEIDAHGDFMTAAEIEKAAHQFLKDARNVDTQHDFESGAGEVVESYVTPTDIQIGTELIKQGTWVLVTKATEEVWESIQKGEITGYSMAGTAETREVEKQADSAAEETFTAGIVKQIRDFFAVKKGEIKDKFYDEKKKRDFRAAFYLFDDVFFSELWSGEPDVQRIKDAAVDFAELLQDIANSPDILKAIGPFEKEEVIRMKKEELQALIKAELEPLHAKLDAVEKAQIEGGEEVGADGAGVPDVADVEKGANEPGGEDTTQTELIEALKAAMQSELAPLTARLEAVEKARGISNQVDTDIVHKAEDVDPDNIFKSLFTLPGTGK